MTGWSILGSSRTSMPVKAATPATTMRRLRTIASTGRRTNSAAMPPSAGGRRRLGSLADRAICRSPLSAAAGPAAGGLPAGAAAVAGRSAGAAARRRRARRSTPSRRRCRPSTTTSSPAARSPATMTDAAPPADDLNGDAVDDVAVELPDEGALAVPLDGERGHRRDAARRGSRATTVSAMPGFRTLASFGSFASTFSVRAAGSTRLSTALTVPAKL